MLCEDEDGNEEEVVVKLRAGIETKEMGSTSELMAALFAQDLGLPVPSPRLVEIEKGFDRAVTQGEVLQRLRDSVGWNFGSKKLDPGFTTWPKDKPIPMSLRPLAAEIFAFDTIIQNPDRRRGNPNLLWKADELFIYDHELSLTFFLPTLGWQPPWTGRGLEFLRDHVFYEGLKGTGLSWDRFTGALEAITDKRLQKYIATVPDEWKAKSDAADKIMEYFKEARRNRKALITAITEMLK